MPLRSKALVRARVRTRQAQRPAIPGGSAAQPPLRKGGAWRQAQQPAIPGGSAAQPPLRSSLKIGQALQSIRYKAHELLPARVTIRRTREPCKNGSEFLRTPKRSSVFSSGCEVAHIDSVENQSSTLSHESVPQGTLKGRCLWCLQDVKSAFGVSSHSKEI